MAQEEKKQQQTAERQQLNRLPGENGFHARDGSLTKKKREQWEQEKAEAEKSSWFPFGRKLLSSAKRKSTPKEAIGEAESGRCSLNNKAHQNPVDSQSPQRSEEKYQQMEGQMPLVNAEEATQFQHGTATNYAGTSSVLYQPPLAAHGNVSPMLPFYMDVHFQQPQYLALPNLVPMQTTAHYGPAFSPFPLTMGLPVPAASNTFVDPAMYFVQQKVPPFSVLPTPPFSGSSSSDSANSPPNDVQQRDENFHSPKETLLSKQQSRVSNQTTNSRWQDELDKQVKERRAAEQMEIERRHAEQQALEKEKMEKARNEEEQKAAEERRRSQKLEDRDHQAQECLNSIQRAQREAELLRRAKLFRHILMDGEADLETAKKVLKTNDEAMVKDVLKQLRELEMQRRIATNTNIVTTGKSPKPQRQGTPKETKDTVYINKERERSVEAQKSSPFTRANSWSMKQSRTIPNQSFLPVPIRQQKKQQKQKDHQIMVNSNNGQMHRDSSELHRIRTDERNICGTSSPVGSINHRLSMEAAKADEQHCFIQSQSSHLGSHRSQKPPAPRRKNESGIHANGCEKREHPLGLFEQLTLRRPRLNSLEANKQRAQQYEQMLASSNDGQQQQQCLHGTLREDLNGNPENLSAGAQAKENGAIINSASSTQANSPGSSSCSVESASVIRFRALLRSPSESQEELTCAELVDKQPLPPLVPLGHVKNGNGPFLVPQSPFSRRKISANDANDLNGNKEDFFNHQGGLRRSLRSPTMRRLQDSLQSLATIDGASEAADSRNSTPKPFNCRNAQYRSFNMRHDTARQKQILEHLAAVRAQLKCSQANLEKTISKQNLAGQPDEEESSNGKKDAFL